MTQRGGSNCYDLLASAPHAGYFGVLSSPTRSPSREPSLGCSPNTSNLYFYGARYYSPPLRFLAYSSVGLSERKKER